MDKHLEEIMEEFYTLFETGLDNYKRPVDYKERFMRYVNKIHKPAFESKGRQYHEDQ